VQSRFFPAGGICNGACAASRCWQTQQALADRESFAVHSKHWVLLRSSLFAIMFCLQVVPAMELAQLQQMLADAAALEQARRRQALEITFLQANAPPLVAAGAESSTTAAAAAGDPASSSSEDDDDDDDAAAAVGGDGDGYEAGYSKGTRLRIQQAPADIAAQMAVPLARFVQECRVYMCFASCCAEQCPYCDIC
jgi:hypothetical protein